MQDRVRVVEGARSICVRRRIVLQQQLHLSSTEQKSSSVKLRSTNAPLAAPVPSRVIVCVLIEPSKIRNLQCAPNS